MITQPLFGGSGFIFCAIFGKYGGWRKMCGKELSMFALYEK